VSWTRKQLPGILALVLVLVTFLMARLPAASQAEKRDVASGYGFTPMSISLPGGFDQQTIRKVNKDYQHIDGWISSVGAAIAMNDLDGDGLDNDLCVVDPRIDQVVVTPAPGAKEERYEAFALSPGTLPMNDVMAPMGCVPGDFNEDGRTDLLVYMWGRTPIAHIAKDGQDKLTSGSYTATELVPGANATSGRYTGPQWNTNAAAVADFDGDGHDDIFIGNYFPHGPVLDSSISGGVEMNDSMSAAYNGGVNYFLRWNSTSAGVPRYDVQDGVQDADASKGWELGAAAADLDGDLLPELYLANDFGPDRMYHNRSTPGRIELALVEGVRTALTPKSKVVGHDSFKGMGVDFGDLNQDGVYDMFVSNITTSYGIQESNFQFMSQSGDKNVLRAKLANDEAPWEDVSAPAGTAWSGWGWDVKIADFANSGEPAIAQATGFVRGQVNRWPQLQELATSNDLALRHPVSWPRVTVGDDVGGNHRLAFYVKDGDRYVDIAEQLGLAIPVPTRGIATGDADGDGKLDFAVARQWAEPVFYRNSGPSQGSALTLRLCHEGGSPAVGAQVTATTREGRTFIGHVDGGGGHSGKRGHEVHIGLGKTDGPVEVRLNWRDRSGQTREHTLTLEPGRHLIELGSQAKER
jgi:hypothetical protein